MSKCFAQGLAVIVFLNALNVFAFNAAVDTQEGITLRIAGFEDSSTRKSLAVTKVSAEAPLSINVTATNASTNSIQGTLRVWMNDDWDVSAGEKLILQIEPGKSWQHSFLAIAKSRVVTALYPVHADLTVSSPAITLHPIAVVEAVKSESVFSKVPQPTALPDRGVIRLDSEDCRVSYEQNGVFFDLGFAFAGTDEMSGMAMFKNSATRGGVTRRGFGVHPPYRGEAGVTWNDFTLELPKTKPIRLDFFTALRDHSTTEPPSDGTEHKVFAIGADSTEHELFSRFSASKTWEPASVDLSAFAGESITLRLWTGPGPKGDTLCDLCYWGDPTISIGSLPTLQTEAAWQSLDSAAVGRARHAISTDSALSSGEFKLEVDGIVFGAGVALGKQGLTDGVIAFSDGSRDLIYRGFICDIDDMPVGGVDNGSPVLEVEATTKSGVLIVTHRISSQGKVGAPSVSMRARIWTEGGALRIAWDMSGTVRTERGTPLFTRLGIGSAHLPVWRAYAGFGNVIENPESFDLYSGGFTLSTRHVGADYTNGMSLVQASDIFPDRVVYSSSTRRFSLEVHHDVSFFFVPSNKGAFAAAREYGLRSGFQKGPGVDTLLGRICLDQWGGDYLAAADDIKKAAQYGVTNAVFVKHDWQRWGYDYRLPEIYPPSHGLDRLLVMRQAARDVGMLFCPHDNYIDFYPDAEGFSYDHIVFDKSGEPVKAWYNNGRGAQSYRWLPHAFAPWMEANMRLIQSGFSPDSLFIDVFTAIAPFDYYDRSGLFYPSTRTASEWRKAFDTCREILGEHSAMISEAGTDALIGSVDAAQADHFPAERWVKIFDDADRTPWHDMVTHGKMILFAGGLGSRYNAPDWNRSSPADQGYGSDDYLSNTVLGGRNPMCDGPFSRRTVMTYWLLHDVCDALSRQAFETHAFGATVKQQHTTFSNRGSVWANRGTNLVWNVADGKLLPEYGFYAKTPGAEAGIVLIDGHRAAFAKSATTFFANARPSSHSVGDLNAENKMLDFGLIVTDGAFRLVHDGTRDWQLIPLPNSKPFRAEIRLDSLRDSNLKVKSVEGVDLFQNRGASPVWTQDGSLLRIACDAKAFAYRILFDYD